MKAIFFLFPVLAFSCKTYKKDESDFDVFFKKFASDSVFQKKHVAFPLAGYYSEDSIGTKISKKDYFFDDFTQDKELYDVSTQKKGDTVYYVRTWRETFGAMTYKFVRKKNSWNLIEVRDITE